MFYGLFTNKHKCTYMKAGWLQILLVLNNVVAVFLQLSLSHPPLFASYFIFLLDWLC